MSDSNAPRDGEILYCSMHDLYFMTKELRAEHIQYSPDHPYCDTCRRRFLNGNSLRNHYVLSRHHHYCSHCRKAFKTAAGFRMHVEYSPAHSDDSDDEDSDDDPDQYPDGWEDRLGPLRFPDEGREDDDEDQSWLHGDCASEGDTTLVASPTSSDVSDTDSTSEEDITLVAPPTSADLWNSSAQKTAEIPEVNDDAAEPAAVHVVEYSCPICLHTPNIVRATRCGHMFCSPCIRRALKDSETCPICRKAANMRQLRKISMVVPVC